MEAKIHDCLDFWHLSLFCPLICCHFISDAVCLQTYTLNLKSLSSWTWIQFATEFTFTQTSLRLTLILVERTLCRGWCHKYIFMLNNASHNLISSQETFLYQISMERTIMNLSDFRTPNEKEPQTLPRLLKLQKIPSGNPEGFRYNMCYPPVC